MKIEPSPKFKIKALQMWHRTKKIFRRGFYPLMSACVRLNFCSVQVEERGPERRSLRCFRMAKGWANRENRNVCFVLQVEEPGNGRGFVVLCLHAFGEGRRYESTANEEASAGRQEDSTLRRMQFSICQRKTLKCRARLDVDSRWGLGHAEIGWGTNWTMKRVWQ